MRLKYILSLLLTSLILWACTANEDTVPAEKQPDDIPCTDCRIAVILPMGDGLDHHWQRTLDLCTQNLRLATRQAGTEVCISYEMYDEQHSDLVAWADSIVASGDVTAVIGGLYSTSAKTLASRLVRGDVPLFTLATTEQLVRGYAGWGNLWAMTETDITQCEVLLTKASMYGDQSVALIARQDDAYCQTFIDWFSFQAEELGLQNLGLYLYTDPDPSLLEAAFESGADCVICAPAEIEDIAPMLRAQQAVQQRTGRKVRALFSDTAYGADVIAKTGSLCEGLEGVTFGADPSTGFEVSYRVLFDEDATLGEAQVYDACMLIGLAVMQQQLQSGLTFRKAMQELVSGRDRNLGGWMLEDMTLCATALAAGDHPDLSGASGNLDFDAKVFTNVLSTIYYNYVIYNQQYVIIDHNSTDGSKRSDATLAGWNWKAQQMQHFSEEASSLTYPPLHQRWALLVAASSGWENYRHQADVLNMYQILRSHGYDDDNIILIIEDDLAQNPQNPKPGVVCSRIGGDNVRLGAVVDYHPSELLPADLTDILTGRASKRLPEVISSDADDNVLIFWSGHGTPGGMNWMRTGLFTYNRAHALFTALQEAHAYRRLLWLAETYYSGGVAKAVEGHRGMLAISAANADETSKADEHDLETDIWLSNRFTATLHDCLTADASISMRDLYYRLFQNTVGSHVCVFGAEGYGNLYTSTMAEFVGTLSAP